MVLNRFTVGQALNGFSWSTASEHNLSKNDEESVGWIYVSQACVTVFKKKEVITPDFIARHYPYRPKIHTCLAGARQTQ